MLRNSGGGSRQEDHCGTGTTRGLASQVKPAYCFSCLPLPRLPPEQLSSLLMQLSVHMLMTVLSQAPNQSAWNVVPARPASGGMSSRTSVQVRIRFPCTRSSRCHRPYTMRRA